MKKLAVSVVSGLEHEISEAILEALRKRGIAATIRPNSFHQDMVEFVEEDGSILVDLQVIGAD